MLWRERCQTAIMLLGISILILFISIIGFRTIDQGIRHLYHVQSGYAEGKTGRVDDMVHQPGKPNTQIGSQATLMDQQQETVSAMAPVRAQDIVKGKVNASTPAGLANADQRTQAGQSPPVQSHQSAVEAQTSNTSNTSMTSGLLVERASVGMGILLKKGARSALDGLLNVLETTKITSN